MKQFLLARYGALRLLFCLFLSFMMDGALAQAPSFTLHKYLPGDTTQQMAYGNGIYLAVVISPVRFYASTNGADWTAVSTPDFGRSYYLRPILSYGAGLFVCVADSGKVFTSPDGNVWTRRSSGKGANFKDVEFLQNAFYAVGDSATLLHSGDGITWDALTTGIGTPLDTYDSITYGNGYTMITATDPNVGKVLYRSGAGTLSSWTADTVAGLESVKFLKDHFYLFADNDVLRSTDGTGWTSIIQPGVFSYVPFSGFYDGVKIYMLVNEYATGGTSGLLYPSTDGVTFSDPLYLINRITGVLYANQLYFTYGVDGIETSSDNANYHSIGADYSALASNGTGYVAVRAANNRGEIFTSPDFETWAQNATLAAIRLYSVNYDGTRYIAAGNDGSEYEDSSGNPFVYTSPDGANWTYVGPQQIRGVGVPYINTVTAGAGVLVGMGNDGAGGQTLAISGAGDYWSSGTNQSPYTNLYVKFVHGYFFILADSNTLSPTGMVASIRISPDGSNWTNVTPILPFTVGRFSDVVYDGTRYTLMGTEGDANTGAVTGFFSVSTTDVTNPSSYGAKGTLNAPPAGAALKGASFAYSNGHFTGGAIDMNAPGNGYLLYSTDGLHWDNIPLGPIGRNFIGNISNGDVFRLMSQSNVALTVSFSGVPLPVTLLNFTAQAAGHSSLLTWQTAQEENSSRFLIQHSVDGMRWDSIGVVAAARQSDVVTDYRFTDPSPQNGYDYYRLLLLDLDGRSQLSPVRSVYFGEGRVFRVYPNPAGGSTTLELPEIGVGVVFLYNAAGAEVLRQEFNGYAITLSLQGLPAGVYHFSVRQNGKQYQREILHR